MSIKEVVKEKIEDSFRDMSAHSYNEYAENSERIICLAVSEMRELYTELGGDAEELSTI